MNEQRIHVFGASGSGCTTLGKALSEATGIPVFDGDDYYWPEGNGDYTIKRDAIERNNLLERDLSISRNWILSGSIDGWNSDVPTQFTHVVFLNLDTSARLNRLWARARERYGADAVVPGGRRFEGEKEFIEWASHYEDGTQTGRSRPRHESFLKSLQCPILRLDSLASVEILTARCVTFVGH